MRNLLKIVAIIGIVFASTAANAQTLKFGHIDLQALIQVMPERTTMESEFNKFQTDIEDVFNGMQTELQQKIGEYQNMGEETSQVKKDAKVTEINDLSQKLENYRNNAGQQLQQKQNELLQPIYEKAQKAIEEVAKAQGLIYVFEASAGGVVLYKSNQSIDVLPLVKTQLGIQ